MYFHPIKKKDARYIVFVFVFVFASLPDYPAQEKDAGYIVDLQLGLAARPNRPPALKSAVREEVLRELLPRFYQRKTWVDILSGCRFY